jgi:hypothetical protein
MEDDRKKGIERLKAKLKEYESQFSEIDNTLYKRGKKYRNENLERQKDAYFSEISKIKEELKKLKSA